MSEAAKRPDHFAECWCRCCRAEYPHDDCSCAMPPDDQQKIEKLSEALAKVTDLLNDPGVGDIDEWKRDCRTWTFLARAALRLAREGGVSDVKMCDVCRCCEMDWEECWACGGDGTTGPGELYEEDPLWYDPGDFEDCRQCEGRGGWPLCGGRCDENGKHRAPAATTPT